VQADALDAFHEQCDPMAPIKMCGSCGTQILWDDPVPHRWMIDGLKMLRFNVEVRFGMLGSARTWSKS